MFDLVIPLGTAVSEKSKQVSFFLLQVLAVRTEKSRMIVKGDHTGTPLS